MGIFPRQWWRLGGLAAILFIVLFVVGVALQSSPPLVDDPVDEIRADWVNDGQTYLAADYLLGLAFVFFYVPFIVALRGLLGQAEGGINLWSGVSFVGALFFMFWAVSSSAFWGALAFAHFAETASDETLSTLMVLDYYAVAGMPLTWVLFVGATSLAIWQTGVIWRWLVYVGLVEVILALFAPLAIFSAETNSFFDTVYLLAFFGVALWILLVGLAMLTKKQELAAVGPLQTA
jgi:hypothetical protein